jgi:dipeptidyl aminopeptidase/acylaminoacyl peptidase
LSVPPLLLHSRTDPKVLVTQALALQLEKHEKTYELVVYEQDRHGLPRHRSERNQRSMAYADGRCGT